MLCLVPCIQIFCPCEHVILLADVSFSFLKIFTLIFVHYAPLVFYKFIIGSFVVWDTFFQTKWTEISKLKFWPGSGLLPFLGPPSSGSWDSFSCFSLHTILRLRLLMIVQLPPLSFLSLSGRHWGITLTVLCARDNSTTMVSLHPHAIVFNL